MTFRACIVKHPYYPNFPWESARYSNPEQTLGLFRYGSQNISFMIGTKADMWIVEGLSVRPAFFIDEKHPGVFKELYEAHNTVLWSAIPWDEYDIVITIDPILSERKDIVECQPQTLWIYAEPDHRAARAKSAAYSRPWKPYDLFWDHFMRADDQLHTLPQSVSFPYFTNPDIMRNLVKPTRETGVFLDSRYIFGLTKRERGTIAMEFETLCGLPIKYPPLDGQESRAAPRTRNLVEGKMLRTADFLKLLGSCKYFATWRGKGTGGQAALEAAALGLIAIANDNAAYPRMLCHPTCLVKPNEIPRKVMRLIRKIERDPGWQAEILLHQDEALWEKFWDGPLGILEKALKMKRAGR